MVLTLRTWALGFVVLLAFSCSLRAVDADFVVALDGSGDFTTVQAAFDAVPAFRKKRTVILVKPGEYVERITLAATKAKVSLIGEDPERTVIVSAMHSKSLNRFGEEVGTTGSSGFFLFGREFTCRNITFENRAGPVGQAVAVRVDGDQAYFENCRFIGNQDTLYPHGKGSRQYYKDCYIEGTVDFIFGWSIAYFENCEIFCKTSGYVTAASTDEGQEFGFVFKDCRIVGDAPEGSFYLGRPWRPFAKTVFINCEMGPHIKPEGWHNWGKEDAEKTSFYAEYGSRGLGAATAEARVSWSHQLREADLGTFEREVVLGGWDLSKVDE